MRFKEEVKIKSAKIFKNSFIQLVRFKEHEENSDNDDYYEYTALKIQQGTIKNAIKKRMLGYPDIEIILYIVTPNAQTL